ncbi:head decoration protein [Pseudomonas phage vB_PseuGesM_254]|uniref:Head decoration protein n=1 Tax=Pseudomonas phage vB_PseuGesM_254 TaxID=3092638 RepID=A0AAX4G6F5_9CAUD|nr:head decoration protein [Pseudomonas phage PseuGes_254]
MGIIATDVQRIGNWLKHEYEPSSEYCREVVNVTIVKPRMTTGSVLDASGALVTKANIANAKYILMDDVDQNVPAGVSKRLVLARGPAKVAIEALVFAADVLPADKAPALAALAALGILADKQI